MGFSGEKAHILHIWKVQVYIFFFVMAFPILFPTSRQLVPGETAWTSFGATFTGISMESQFFVVVFGKVFGESYLRGMKMDMYIYIYLYIYIHIPGTCLSSILGVEPSKTRPFSSKTRVIWVLGIYMSTHMLSWHNRPPT